MKQENSPKLENKLLTALLQTSAGNEALDFLKSPLDWKYIIETAEAHKVVPLLLRNITARFADVVPAAALSELQERQQEIATLNFVRAAQLIKIVGFLQKNNIPVIAYKGLALAAFIYGDITMRQFTDIDLLIKKKDFPRLKELAAEVDCKPAWELTDKQEEAVLKYYYEYPFLHGENDTFLEVHWEFVEPFFVFDFNVNELFNRTETVRVCGKIVPTLSAEDSLIVLCSHGSKHFWERLSWICDIAHLIKRKNIDWNLLIQRARKAGSLRMLWLGLYLASDVLNAELPPEISVKIQADSNVKIIAERLKVLLLNKNRTISGTIEMAQVHLKMRERKRDKLKYSYRLFMTKAIDSLFMPMGRPQ